MRHGSVVYLDTNCIIEMVEGVEPVSIFLVENAAEDIIRLYTSELTLAEVLVGPLKSGNKPLVEIYEEVLTSDDVLKVLPVDRTVLRRSAEIKATLGNKGPDAIHVASASVVGCSVFVSSDERIKLPPQMTQLRIDQITDLDSWP